MLFRSTQEIYVNGLSTSLPRDVQEAMIRTIPGCEQANVIRYGYAVEYDYLPPTQLRQTLEMRNVPGLFVAGQLNGTSGYEEAAAQGFVAGVNAAHRVLQRPPFILRRDQAYIGVLIDDLITKGTEEPYRMFTSRAEYRMLLREDTVQERLLPLGKELGLLPECYEQKFEREQAEFKRSMAMLRAQSAPPGNALDGVLEQRGSSRLHQATSLLEILRRPEIELEDLLPFVGEEFPRDPELWRRLATEVKYAGYLAKEREEVVRQQRMETVLIPDDFDYASVPGLSAEVRQKLLRIRPQTLGQAGRISGVTPAALSILTVRLKSRGSW